MPGITDSLNVLRIGHGPAVVLVHGTGGSREDTWSDQLILADHHSLILPDRRGYGESDPAAQPDFERDGEDIADLLEGGAHLVGFSYGGIGAMIAAAKRPDAVLSLTLIEPNAFGLVRGQKAVDDLVALKGGKRSSNSNRQPMAALDYPAGCSTSASSCSAVCLPAYVPDATSPLRTSFSAINSRSRSEPPPVPD
jgi:pimeloyl-ACP methyl ester carboxylesterase